MSENPLFNINFVKSIEKRPCIWNYTLTEYSKRNFTEKAWLEVADEFNDSVPNCRERWRNIRGCFLRSMKKPANGFATNTKKKYYLNEYLEFILPYLKNNGHLRMVSDYNKTFEEDNSGSEIHADNQEQCNIESLAGQSSQLGTLHNLPLDMTDENTQGSSPWPGENLVNDKSGNSTKRQIPQIASIISKPTDDPFKDWIKNINERDISKDHPNMLFLRSLLPDIMKMTDKQNRRFRQKVIGLTDDILEDADLHVCQSSTSNPESVNDVSSVSPYTSRPVHLHKTSEVKTQGKELPETTISAPLRKKKRIEMSEAEETLLLEATKCLQESSSTNTIDPCVSFGSHVTNELRKYGPKTLTNVKHGISKIIFEADIRHFTKKE